MRFNFEGCGQTGAGQSFKDVLKIAHRFVGGYENLGRISPVRDERKSCVCLINLQTLRFLDLFLSSLRGTLMLRWARQPSDKSLGYCQIFLRNKSCSHGIAQ